MPNCLL